MRYPAISAKFICTLLLISLSFLAGYGQDLSEEDFQFTAGFYMDLFYGFDFNRPTTEQRLPYLYHHNRHNEFNLNHGIISASLTDSRFNVNLGFHAGTYVNDNYSSEPETLRNIYDANIAVAVDRRKRWWLETGIFGSSWIGMEETKSIDNMNLGHLLISENVPYYYAGFQTRFIPIDRVKIILAIVNGWQRIQRVKGNSLPSFGSQITYESKGDNSYNWSSFVGTDDPDSIRRMRIVNHFDVYLDLSSKVRFGGGVDVGTQQASKGSNNWQQWYGMALILQYKLSDQWRIAGRYEYFHDDNEVLVESLNPLTGYRTSGVSGNVDVKLFDLFLARFEARWFQSPDEIYPEKDATLEKGNFFLLASIAMDLNRSFSLNK